MQTLKFAGDDLNLITGKQITIRNGIRVLQGEILLVDRNGDEFDRGIVESCRHCLLKNLTAQELDDYGYSYLSLPDALTELRKYYPEITLDHAVTVIRFQVREDAPEDEPEDLEPVAAIDIDGFDGEEEIED